MSFLLLIRTSLFQFLLALPHFLVLLWVLWLIFTPTQVAHLLSRKNKPSELNKSGELMSFREIFAVGCVGGFLLLTFITAYCCWITLSVAGIL
ncbi:MAG: hypothetical protein M3R04_04760 [bacterium]|nr:hypothetical protein [bacterium]